MQNTQNTIQTETNSKCFLLILDKIKMNHSILILSSIIIVIICCCCITTTINASQPPPVASCTDSTTGDTGIVDPYSGECLSVTDPNSVILPCSEATSVALCNGCKTCAVPPDCTSCMNTPASSADSVNNNEYNTTNGCPVGKATEYSEYSCLSVDPVYLREVSLSSIVDEVASSSSNSMIGIKDSTSIDILLSSGITTPTSPVKVNSPEYFRQKTSTDEMLLFSSSNNNQQQQNSNNNGKLVVALYWIPPVALTIFALFVLHYLIVKS